LDHWPQAQLQLHYWDGAEIGVEVGAEVGAEVELDGTRSFRAEEVVEVLLRRRNTSGGMKEVE